MADRRTKIMFFREMMKMWLLLLCALAAACADARAQSGRGFIRQGWTIDRGDSIPHIEILAVPVFSRAADLKRYERLVRAVRKVYPVAKTARKKLAEMEARLGEIDSKKGQKAYIRQVYDEIKREYTPVLKRMTRTEGRVLLKLIDRETEYTAYEVLREFRGGFIAGFWQGVSRIFGQDLKSEYDAEGEDRMIEQIIIYHEAGLI